MDQTVRDVMRPEPATVQAGTPLADTARVMRDSDVGAIVVVEGSRLAGIVTDRDIVVRAVADGRDPMATTVAEICTGDLVTVTPDEPVEQAAQLMRERAVRRLPVVEADRAVGIVSLADLTERDTGQVSETLSEVTAAAPNS